MASMSRFVLKDYKLQTCDSLYRPNSCFPARRLQTHLYLKGGLLAHQNGTSRAIQSKLQSPIVALSASSSSIQTPRNSQILCKAASNASGDVPGSNPSGMTQYERIIETLTTLFPVWVILGTIIGIYKPAAVTWLETDLFTIGLGFLMLSMGLTLTFEDFRRCLRNPWTVGVGFLAQYLIKPMLGFFIASMLVIYNQMLVNFIPTIWGQLPNLASLSGFMYMYA